MKEKEKWGKEGRKADSKWCFTASFSPQLCAWLHGVLWRVWTSTWNAASENNPPQGVWHAVALQASSYVPSFFCCLSHVVVIFLHFQLVSPVPSWQTFWEGRASWILSAGLRCRSHCDFCYKGLNEGRDHWQRHRERPGLSAADLPRSLLGWA